MQKSERLQTVASFVRKGSIVYDIGTDHGKIPVSLLLHDHCPSAVLTDISSNSLDKAIRHAAKSGVNNRVTSVCANGTLGIKIEENSDIIISGMGGELITKIIDQDPRLQNDSLHFILQPMTKTKELRQYLHENGYEIITEAIVKEQKHFYFVLSVRFTKNPPALPLRQALLGRNIILNETLTEYASQLLKRLRFKFSKTNLYTNPEQMDIAFELREQIIELTDFLEEQKNANFLT